MTPHTMQPFPMARWVYRLSLGGLAVLVVASVLSAMATSNTVPESGADQASQGVTANDLKPAACASLDLANVVSGSTGGSSNDLVLGSGGSDTLSGGGGADCLVGGAGNDTLTGGPGNDVLIGGAGTDTCTADGGTDTYHASCEVQE